MADSSTGNHDSDGATANASASTWITGLTEKKRRRPPLACEQCRQRKIKCDRNSPCGHCTRARIESCTYAPTHVPATKNKKASTSNTPKSTPGSRSQRPVRPAPDAYRGSEINETSPVSVQPGLAASKSPSSVLSTNAGSTSDASNVERLLARVHELEEKLSSVVHITESKDSRFGQLTSDQVNPLVGTVSKTRYFGNSHWLSVTDLLPTEFALLGRAEREKADVYQVLVKCKSLARKIKQNRQRPLSSEDIGKSIPPREVADQLVKTYFRAFEGVLRILHKPTFWSEYERYWQNPGAANIAFVVQLQACLALGASLHDDVFSMRPTAMHWIYEAQLWLILPPEKNRMTITGIQTMCLLVLARSCCGVGHDLNWVTMGSLVRMAMHMGLHRDPKHLGTMTVYRAEMRRRLWSAILELNVQSSFEAGGSPLLSTSDYDTELPANLNDDQLVDDNDGQSELGQPAQVPTDCSVHLALLSSLPLRLELIKHVNDFRSTRPYEEVLRLNSELTKACRELTHSLSALQTKQGGPNSSQINYFHTAVAEMFTYRFFHALHQTAIVKSFNDHRFYFSRRMCLDSALKLLHLWGLSGSTQPHPAQSEDGFRDCKRLVDNGSGIFRYVAVQSLFFVAVELIHQKKGQSVSLGYLPSIGDSDLRGYLVAANSWTLERIYSGETNGKGHCFVSACLGHVDALSAGLSPTETDNAILRAATDSANRCLEALKKVAEREGLPSEDTVSEAAEVEGLPTMPIDWMGDWAWDDMDGLTWEQWPQDALGGMDHSNLGAY